MKWHPADPKHSNDHDEHLNNLSGRKWVGLSMVIGYLECSKSLLNGPSLFALFCGSKIKYGHLYVGSVH